MHFRFRRRRFRLVTRARHRNHAPVPRVLYVPDHAHLSADNERLWQW